jgi:hypothetical protein
MLSQKRILGHIKVETKKVVLLKQSKGKIETEYTVQTWVWASLITGSLTLVSAPTSGIMRVKK